MKIVSGFKHIGYPVHLLGRLLRGCHLVLDPVAFLLESQLFYKILVVREVVDAVERRNILESFDKHSLLSERIVVEGAVDFSHSFGFRPLLCR